MGASWKRFDHDVTAHATMMSSCVNPHDAAQVCCVSRCGEVFATADTGATWKASQLPRDVQDVYAVACG